MSTPEYTLKQAISIYEMASRRYQGHINGGCEQCVGWFAVGPHCKDGHTLMLLCNKWIRRMRQAASLEGVQITLPTLISERISR
jgi:hypothetical protein